MGTLDAPGTGIEPILSLVIPVRDEQPNVAPLISELREALSGLDYEVVFVDDGSRDGTFEALRAARETDPRLRALRFRTGAGKAEAYQAGFRASRGRLVATLDGDLQDDPRDLLAVRAKLEEGFDLVVGWKRTGKSSPLSFVLSRLLNGLIRLVSRVKLHDMNCPVRIMRAEVAKSLELSADLHRYIPILAAARGFKIAEIPVRNRPRQHGVSKYRSTKYWSSAVAFLGVGLYLRFGDRPMALFGGIGLASFLTGFGIDAYYAGRYVFAGVSIDEDFPTVVLGVLLILIGTQFLSLGLLAEIVIRRLRAVAGTSRAEVVETL